MQQLFMSQQSIKPSYLAFLLVNICVCVCVCVCVSVCMRCVYVCNAGNMPCCENKKPLQVSLCFVVLEQVQGEVITDPK